jgi:excisionase family DNA binding protein
MSDQNTTPNNFDDWIKNIIEDAIEDALRKFQSERNIPYYSPSTDTNRVVTLKEAAVYCGICTRTLISRVRVGKLKSGGTGRNYRFRISDLDDFMFKEKN